MRISPFAIERYYERWEFRAELMLSSSDCESHVLSRLLELEPDAHERLLSLHLGYTEVPGSPELLAAVAALYEGVAQQDVLTLAAAEEGIFIAYHALLGPGRPRRDRGAVLRVRRRGRAQHRRGRQRVGAPLRGGVAARPRGARGAAAPRHPADLRELAAQSHRDGDAGGDLRDA